MPLRTRERFGESNSLWLNSERPQESSWPWTRMIQEDFLRVMPLSEELWSSVSSVTNRESSITSSDLLLNSSWREDSKHLLQRSNSPNLSIMLELELDNVIYALVNNWSTSHPSWYPNHLSLISLLPQPLSSSLVRPVELRERREPSQPRNDEASSRSNDQIHYSYFDPLRIWCSEYPWAKITILVRSTLWRILDLVNNLPMIGPTRAYSYICLNLILQNIT